MLTKIKKVLKGEEDNESRVAIVWFNDRTDGESPHDYELEIDRREWEDMGKPESIVVTIEVGDSVTADDAQE